MTASRRVTTGELWAARGSEKGYFWGTLRRLPGRTLSRFAIVRISTRADRSFLVIR